MDANDNRKRWIVRTVVLLAAGTIGLLAWSRRGSFSPVDAGTLAPDYHAVDLAGDTVRLADHRGRVVLVNVWATWCRPCVKEMPAIETVYRKFNTQGFDVLAISIDNAALGAGDPSAAVRDFAGQFDLTFPILLDPQNHVEDVFTVSGLPMSYLIDRDGRIHSKYIGPREWDTPEFESEIRSLLES
jgi:peroxiredoxin